ncbi:hypothetical protein Glove_117g483 [Diversispora epigaea]|uniref:Uncharacterized protein n=1 Tax=Diversispora epigaea TaxID=1348612 RepID=A0A397J0G3_9GLOM|nr:hypothetical protein Glove_117g483 [Diversispora epigaea]
MKFFFENITFEFNVKSLLAAKQIVLDKELKIEKIQDNFVEIQSSLPPEISDLDKINDKTIEYRETKHIMPIIDIIDEKFNNVEAQIKHSTIKARNGRTIT